MQDQGLPSRSLRTGICVAVFLVFVLWAKGHETWAFGVAVGSSLSLFSLWSLVALVPKLIANGSGASKVGIAVFFLMKLPIYAFVLSLVIGSPRVESMGVFAGVGLAPLIIALKTLGYQLTRATVAPTGE